jgi:hypothetical protein
MGCIVSSLQRLQIHLHRGERLPDLVVKVPREMAAFLLLHVHEPLR